MNSNVTSLASRIPLVRPAKQLAEDIKSQLMNRHVVGWRSLDRPSTFNMTWEDLWSIGTFQHELIEPFAVNAAVEDWLLKNNFDNPCTAFGAAMRLACSGKVLEAGELMESYGKCVLDAFAETLADNLQKLQVAELEKHTGPLPSQFQNQAN